MNTIRPTPVGGGPTARIGPTPPAEPERIRPAAAEPPGVAMDRVVSKPRWRKWAPIAAAVGALVLAAGAYLAISPGAGAKTVALDQVQVAEVRRAPFADFVPARAEVAPLETVFVDAVEGGRVQRLVAADGATVGAGALLAVLENPQLQREVGAREAEVSGRMSDTRGQLLDLQRSQFEREREISAAGFDKIKAELALRQREELHRKGYVSDAEMQRLRDEANYHRDRVAALRESARREAAMAAGQSGEIRATARQLQENLGAVRGSLGALQIRAPTAGRLTAFELQPGQTVRAGDRVGQIDSLGAYKLVAQIDEFYLGRVSPGQSASAQLNGRAYPLRVGRIFPQVSNGRFQVELAFAGVSPPDVRRGQSLEVEVTLGATAPALIAPNAAFLEATGGTWAFVLDESGRRAERRVIRTGRRNPQHVEVLSGLQPGERIVTSSYDGFEKQTRLLLR